jgi:hypothetical protein
MVINIPSEPANAIEEFPIFGAIGGLIEYHNLEASRVSPELPEGVLLGAADSNLEVVLFKSEGQFFCMGLVIIQQEDAGNNCMFS